MTILGIDVSTHAIDLTYLDEDTLAATWQRIELPQPAIAPASRRIDQARAIRHGLRHELERLETVHLAAIEDPASWRGGQAIKALGILTGAIYASLPDRLTILPIRVAEWRTELGALTGLTVRSKEDVRLAVTVLGAAAPDWPQDAYDAYAIALAALHITDRAAREAA